MSGPIHVIKMPLAPNSYAESVLLKRFRAGTCVYNAVLGECKKRANKFWRHPLKSQANALFKQRLELEEEIKLLKKQKQKQKQKTSELQAQVKELKEKYTDLYGQITKEADYYLGTSAPKGHANSIARYVQQFAHSWIGEHLGSKTIYGLAERAFKAVDNMVHGKKLKGGGRKKAKKVKFVSRRHDIKTVHSITGCTENIKGSSERRQREIRWVKDGVIWNIKGGKDLYVKAIIDPKDPVIRRFLEEEPPIHMVSIVRKKIKGKIRYWVHIAVAGFPYIKPENRFRFGKGRIGMDLGPNQIAYFSVPPDGVDDPPTPVGAIRFTELEKYDVRIKELKREWSKLQRYHNPQNFESDFRDANGGWKKGKVKKKITIVQEMNAEKREAEKAGKEPPRLAMWKTTPRMKRLNDQWADMQRKKAECLKCLQGDIVNFIRSLGDDLVIEDDTVVQWQQDKRFSRSVTNYAPAQLVSLLKQKFEQTGGKFHKVNTYKTRLSSRCPKCLKEQKKELSERTHKCDCGCVLDRDIVSSFLAYCCEGDTLQASKAQELYEECGTLLRAACVESESVSENFISELEETKPLTAGSEIGETLSV